ncbi:hypothetical protein HZB58_00660 [Candidatus Gottesmanbacteria bacterium]|nr:hypothetical protein [Candidatus Gottesmanbacteria bacterium]
MKIDVAKQKIILLKDQITRTDAEKTAWDKKTNAFDAISKVMWLPMLNTYMTVILPTR